MLSFIYAIEDKLKWLVPVLPSFCKELSEFDEVNELLAAVEVWVKVLELEHEPVVGAVEIDPLFLIHFKWFHVALILLCVDELLNHVLMIYRKVNLRYTT